MAIELKKPHTTIVGDLRYTYLEYTNGQFFQEGWKDGKLVWLEMPRLPQLEEPKVVAH